ncbi:MAG: hypothetical protein FD167_4302 [bacterium]|nr:MAG: hypothetical protein FD167_4302 [bacterium]
MVSNKKVDWVLINNQHPNSKTANYFAAVVGFNLMAGGELKEEDLKQVHYTVGLAYVSGMFAVGRHLEEESFLDSFLNDKLIFDSLKTYMQINSDSVYKGKPLSFNHDEELMDFLIYAEKQTREIFTQFKKMLLA